MNANNSSALKAYTDVQTKVAVESADQHSLVSMLFSGVVDSLIKVEQSFQSSDLKTRSENITKSQSILFGLRSTLDHDSGGELARLLDSLYDYCIRQLTRSHASNEIEPAREVKGLIKQIGEAWDSMPVEATKLK
jgi:flagellar protein FliS